jgi:aspartate kinase
MSTPTTEVHNQPQPQELPAGGAVTKQLIVQKFGGSSVADADGIKRVAAARCGRPEAGNEVVVVVSAMGDTTDELLDLAAQVTDSAPAREMDMLLSAGERISMALLAMAINKFGASAQSFTGSQAGMITDGIHGKARIIDVDPHRIRTALDKGNIAIVAGFQGMSRATNEITTLGRGGSDTTAVALAAALEADVCEIYTDVDGIYTADPRVVPSAQKIDRSPARKCWNWQPPAPRSCTFAASSTPAGSACRCTSARHSASTKAPGSSPGADDKITTQEGVALEQPIISGVAHDRSEAKVTVVGVPDIPGKAAAIFQVIADAHSNIDMIVQNVSTHGTGRTDISFTLPIVEGADALAALHAAQDQIGFETIEYNEQIGKLSLIGAGMRSHPGVSATFFKALSDAGININMISTSEIRISVVTHADLLDDAVRAIHRAFELDSESEATVYGGTGR